MKQVISLLLLCLGCSIGQAQQKLLSIGDTLPDVRLQLLQPGGLTDTVSLSSLSGRAVLLDFWHRHCSSCIAAFPKVRQLQSRFADSLQVLLVTHNTAAELDALLRYSPTMQKNTLPIAVNDTVLHALIRPAAFPLYVWADSKSIIRGITGTDGLTDAHVRSLLDANNLPAGDRRLLRSLAGRPVLGRFLLQSGSATKAYAIITGEIPSLPPMLVTAIRDTVTHEVIGTQAINQSLYSLYAAAFGPFRRDRVVVALNDPSRFVLPRTGSGKGPLYGYETLDLPATRDDFREAMKRDLERHFNITVEREIRQLTCWVLQQCGVSAERRDTVAEDRFMQDEIDADSVLHLRNRPVAALLSRLRVHGHYSERHPLVDETGYTGKLDIELNMKETNMAALNRQLRPYGLVFRKVRRSLEVVVIKDLPEK